MTACCGKRPGRERRHHASRGIERPGTESVPGYPLSMGRLPPWRKGGSGLFGDVAEFAGEGAEASDEV
jgi:hypothetical protein